MRRFWAILLCAMVLALALAPVASASTKMYTTRSAVLRKSASSSGQALKTIPSGSTVTRLLSYSVNGFYKVSYKGVTGYVLTSCLSTSSSGGGGSGSGSGAGGSGGRPGGGFPGGGMMKPKLTLSQSKLSISIVGDPVQLTAQVTVPTMPGQNTQTDDTDGDSAQTGDDTQTTYTYVWTSTDPTVASVAGGLVTPVGVGSCKVKCIVQTDSGKLTATCKVTVKAVVPTSLTLNSTQLTLNVGETFQLTAEIWPENATNKAVSWKSKKKKVVKVSSTGLLTASKTGTTNVVCTTKSGKIKAVCKVTVVSTAASQSEAAAVQSVAEIVQTD